MSARLLFLVVTAAALLTATSALAGAEDAPGLVSDPGTATQVLFDVRLVEVADLHAAQADLAAGWDDKSLGAREQEGAFRVVGAPIVTTVAGEAASIRTSGGGGLDYEITLTANIEGKTVRTAAALSAGSRSVSTQLSMSVQGGQGIVALAGAGSGGLLALVSVSLQ